MSGSSNHTDGAYTYVGASGDSGCDSSSYLSHLAVAIALWWFANSHRGCRYDML